MIKYNNNMERTVLGWVSHPQAEETFPLHNDIRKVSDFSKIWLCLEEIYVRRTYIYQPELWKKYKGIITWNSKLYEKYKNEFNCILLPTFSYMRKYNFDKSEGVQFKDKINGACLIQRYGGAGYSISETLGCDAVKLRTDLAKWLHQPNKFIVDCYGEQPYNGSQWKTPCPDKLTITTKYKYIIAFENCYHEFWSWDYLTEKMLDAFCCMTVPIYFGCYNIEDKVPKELYIDYRQFFNKPISELQYCLDNISETQYNNMVDKAYQFYQDYPHYKYIDVFKSLLENDNKK